QVDPARCPGMLQGDPHEFLWQGKFQLVAVGKVPPLYDGGLGCHERMRLQQTARSIEVAAKHLQSEKIVVGSRLQRRLQGRPELQAVQPRKRHSKLFRSVGKPSAETEQCRAQLQEVIEE